MKYIDRKHAGLVLAKLLKKYAHRTDVIVLALPRGGVPVAYEIALKLSLALDVFVVRKLGVPGREELAMGAIASGGIAVLNDEIIQTLHISQSLIDSVKQSEQNELLRREQLYRGKRPFPQLHGKTIILVDDGIATGSTMKAALHALKQQKPATIIIAVPVAARSTIDEMTDLADVIVCPLLPIDLHAVGLWYDNFSQTTDDEVIELLEKSKQSLKRSKQPLKKTSDNITTFAFNVEHPITIPSGEKKLDGLLYNPKNALGLVLFVHGSGSSRFSTRNQFVAHQLNNANIATLLFDLLTPSEDHIDNYTREFRFDIGLLASRLMDVTRWCQTQPTLSHLNMGYFGASTGAAAAIVSAAALPQAVHAVVSRGGRPDLAADSLKHISVPTLLIVGGEDDIVIELNQSAMLQMSCIKKLEIVPGATHLFEEQGALEEVSRLAKDWFTTYLIK